MFIMHNFILKKLFNTCVREDYIYRDEPCLLEIYFAPSRFCANYNAILAFKKLLHKTCKFQVTRYFNNTFYVYGNFIVEINEQEEAK